MLPQLKMIYDIINASDDGFGLPIKGIVSKLKKIILLGVILSISVGVGIGYLIFEVVWIKLEIPTPKRTGISNLCDEWEICPSRTLHIYF